MKVCLISTEILGWGNAGGFGFATRSLGRELVARGIKVTAVIPQPRGPKQSETELDEIQVLTYPRLAIRRGIALLRACDADIYHSQEPSLGTWLAQRAMPDRVHVVTSRDPRLPSDWITEMRYPTYSAIQVAKTAVYYDSPLTRMAVRAARAVFVPAHFLVKRVQRKYGLQTPPVFLPTPVRMPATVIKAPEPTVCFVGRLDRRKRPQLFLDLATQFPEVRFIVAGAPQDAAFGDELIARYSHLPNLEMRGFINQFDGNELSRILEASWVLVNTSVREGLPNSFIEACGHGCAILSAVDPDGFTTRFGAPVEDGNFAEGLRRLLRNDSWRAAGQTGRNHVREINDAPKAVELHIKAYSALL